MRTLPALLICLGACAQFPDLQDTISETARNAPYPRLTAIPALPQVDGGTDPAFDARIAALKARAAVLRETDIAALQ